MTIPKFTYTMSVKRNGGDEEVVARNVTAARALLIALEHGGAGRPSGPIPIRSTIAIDFTADGRCRPSQLAGNQTAERSLGSSSNWRANAPGW